VQRGLDRIVESTARMRNFDFAPAEHRSAFRDVQAVMERVELAKTAMRAMGKYVPIDLVRLLYKTGREPRLGGELVDVSLMFTDIKDFTALSERVAPDELALVLGRYLEVMTRAIHASQGTIDKYIGDAIMAVWNVPTSCPGHAGKACEAALACLQAGEMLYGSPEWAGRPRLETRFGLHTAEVMVGHFGAPDRMSFTALGDGVNLASRLEGLNKQYGTTVIASEAVHEQTKEGFTFRLLDIVAVKGKTHGVRVYELLGDTGITGPRLEAARRYEQAFAAYLERRFDEALRLLSAQETHDPPSAVLAERCRRLRKEPPPEEWTGVYVATSK
jgi:adenylate cyclase